MYQYKIKYTAGKEEPVREDDWVTSRSEADKALKMILKDIEDRGEYTLFRPNKAKDFSFVLELHQYQSVQKDLDAEYSWETYDVYVEDAVIRTYVFWSIPKKMRKVEKEEIKL